jgi:hypothetical protein
MALHPPSGTTSGNRPDGLLADAGHSTLGRPPLRFIPLQRSHPENPLPGTRSQSHRSCNGTGERVHRTPEGTRAVPRPSAGPTTPLPNSRRIGRRLWMVAPRKTASRSNRLSPSRAAALTTCPWEHRVPRRGFPPPLRSASDVFHAPGGLLLSEPSDVFQPVTLVGFVFRRERPPMSAPSPRRKRRETRCVPLTPTRPFRARTPEEALRQARPR